MCNLNFTVTTAEGVPPHRKVIQGGETLFYPFKCSVCGEHDRWELARTPLYTVKQRVSLWVCINCHKKAVGKFVSAVRNGYPSPYVNDVKELVTTGCCVGCGSSLLVPSVTNSNPPRAVVGCPVCGAVYKGDGLGRLAHVYSKIINTPMYKESLPVDDSDDAYNQVLRSASIKNVEVFRHLSLMLGWMEGATYTEQDRKLIRQSDIQLRIFPGVTRPDLLRYTQLFDTAIRPSLIT